MTDAESSSIACMVEATRSMSTCAPDYATQGLLAADSTGIGSFGAARSGLMDWREVYVLD